MFRVLVDERVERDVASAPAHVRRALTTKLAALAADPFTPRPGLDVALLRGGDRRYRLRIGSWRFVYVVDPAEQVVILVLASARSSAYR